ncbi:hypothetical protein IHE45_18G052600 [Dioscorea alata]|uniref:Uncharacterized protein n=1 Tax=Dioscorea alata TaxID=55571 RepID=A0ACB7U6U3_DIOAL|nr:hypothetical protein IHE45_18G052600 [Dioscorea alata]
MESRKLRKGSSFAGDELAITKAAAWAWYQHGSGKGHNSFRETELTRPTRSPSHPTRYKLETLLASASASASESDSDSDPDPKLSSPGSANSLFDHYEIERISRHFERLISASDNGRDRAKGKQVNGFWMRRGVAICGARADVVEAHVLGQRRQRRRATRVLA